MNYLYYIKSELVIEYKDNEGKFSIIYTNLYVKKKYIYKPTDYDSDDDDKNIKITDELDEEHNKNISNKILYINDEWIKKSYKKKYQHLLNKLSRDISRVIKIYKKVEKIKKEDFYL